MAHTEAETTRHATTSRQTLTYTEGVHRKRGGHKETQRRERRAYRGTRESEEAETDRRQTETDRDRDRQRQRRVEGTLSTN